MIDMRSDSPDFAELFKVWMRIRNKMNIIENLPRDFGVGIQLKLSEIHTIQAIGNTKENNIRIIADIQGVTPSAVSQMVSRLTELGLVKKVWGVHNNKEVILVLTKKGQIAYVNHEKIHAEIYEKIASQVGDLSEKELELLARVFYAMDSVYARSIREHSENGKKDIKEQSE